MPAYITLQTCNTRQYNRSYQHVLMRKMVFKIPQWSYLELQAIPKANIWESMCMHEPETDKLLLSKNVTI